MAQQEISYQIIEGTGRIETHPEIQVTEGDGYRIFEGPGSIKLRNVKFDQETGTVVVHRDLNDEGEVVVE